MPTAKLQFKEIDLVIYFPTSGNEGRNYLKYGVAFRDRRSGESQPGIRINLEDVLSKPEIKEHYPHTVGYFVNASGRGINYEPEYVETRIIENLQELLRFLGDRRI